MYGLNALIAREGIDNVLAEIEGDNAYGWYCGENNPGRGQDPQPVDQVDAACKQHDICYGGYGLAGSGGVFGQSVEGRACDKQLCSTLRFADCSTSTTPVQCEAARVTIVNIFCLNSLAPNGESGLTAMGNLLGF
jgi:hypothetical protein